MERRGWRAAVAGLGVLVLVGCGAVLVVLLMTQGPQATATAAGIMGVVFGLPGLVIALRQWARRGAAATANQVDQARDSLAGWVIDQWRQEALARSLGDPEPMPVRWRLTDRAVMDHPRLVMADDMSFTGRSDRIGSLAAQFRGLLRRRLVILGGPGSGKTTLAVQLLLELLATRRGGEPIPVLVSLAGWDPAVHSRLRGWLGARLAEDYPALRAFGPDVARALLEQGHVLPILDGLDELPPAQRPEVIGALNASFTDTDQIVLTSRVREYTTAVAEARDVLTAAAVIEPEPLTPAQATEYLRACLPPEPGASWRAVLERLRNGTAPHVAAVAATPLGLWLLRTVYLTARADPAPLLSTATPSAATLQAHLFDQLVPAVLSARPASRNPGEPFRPRHTWDPVQVRGWLTYLAGHLDRAGTRDLLWWHLARHTFTRRGFRVVAGLGTGLVTGVITGVVAGITAGMAAGPIFGLASGLMFGLSSGLVFGLTTGLGAGLFTAQATSPRTWHRTGPRVGVRGLRVGLTSGLAFGLCSGLAGGLNAGLWAGLDTGLREGVVIGVGVGLIYGLAAGIRARLGSRDWLTSEPAYANLQLTHRTAMLVRALGVRVIVGLVVGVTVGLVAGVAIGLVDRLPGALEFGLTYGLTAGFLGGLGAGVVAGLVTWVGTPSGTGWASTPRSTCSSTRTLTVIQVCMVMLTAGLVAGLVSALVTGLRSGLGVGLAYGLGPGVAAGLGVMSSGAWFSYVVTCWRLAAAGKLPRRLMAFLDDAYRLGLLRTTGPAYQFRHAEFHDHLSRAPVAGPVSVPRAA